VSPTTPKPSLQPSLNTKSIPADEKIQPLYDASISPETFDAYANRWIKAWGESAMFMPAQSHYKPGAIKTTVVKLVKAGVLIDDIEAYARALRADEFKNAWAADIWKINENILHWKATQNGNGVREDNPYAGWTAKS
jgi:hypothetical protein